MPRRKRDEKGRLLKKDGTVDRRGETSKQNLKKSGLYQRVIKNKNTYESSDESSEEEEEYDIVEIQKKGKGVKKEPVKEEVKEEVKDEVVEEVKEEPVKEVKEEPVIPDEPPVLKRTKRYKVIKNDSDSDESSDEEETEVIKKRRYVRKIKKYDDERKRYNEELEKVKREKESLRKKVLYNDHLKRVSQLSRDITLKF